MRRTIVRGLEVLRQEGPLTFTKRTAEKVLKLFQTPAGPGTVSASPADRYPQWILENEPGSSELRRQVEEAERFPYRPLISVLVPVYNLDPDILRQTVASVQAQTYPQWELCLVDGGSDRPGLDECLEALAAQDERIRYRRLEHNLGISGNSNAALELAQGEFLALLDHDDLLAPFALYEVVQKLNEDPGWDLLYSDHDLISHDGTRRYNPLFKPGWSPVTLLSANYITHLTVLRTELVRRVGGFNPELDGAQDWELFFRVSELTQKVAHIPKILYHWRDGSGSTAEDIWAKPYAPPAQLRAITGHLQRRGLEGAEAFFDSSGFIRVRWKADRSQKVSIIIPSRGADRLLEACVDSILRLTAYPSFEVIVVNNGPRRPEDFPYYREVSADSRVRVVHYDVPPGSLFNFNSVNNFGVRHATGDLLLFLNNDTEAFTPDWLDELVLWAQREDVGVVGAKLLNPDGKIQHAGVVIGLTGFAGHPFSGQPENEWTIFGLAEWYREWLAVTGACLMVRRAVFERLGGFDERFILCGSDVEFCLRARSNGLRVIYNPFARLYHHEGATRQGAVPPQDFHRSYPYYRPALQGGDPYFNPNLSYWDAAPTLSQPGAKAPLDFVQAYLHDLASESTNEE